MSQLDTVKNFDISRRGFFKIAGSISAATAFAATVAACGSSSQETGASSTGAAGSTNKDGTITAAIAYDVSTTFDPSRLQVLPPSPPTCTSSKASTASSRQPPWG